MKITFYGAAQTVTGSCYVIETDKARFAVDCALLNTDDAVGAVRDVCDALSAMARGRQPSAQLPGHTTGHLFAPIQ